MQIKDKFINEIAKELGITRKASREIVQAQLLFIKKVIRSKEPKSVYLRKVGTFMSKAVYHRLMEEKVARANNKVKIIDKPEEEEPLEF